VDTGLDRLGKEDALQAMLRGKRVGLLAHPASVDRELRHISVVLRGLGIVPQVIFGPEHGYGGEAQDMIGVADARDKSGIPVRSLYGDSERDLRPRDEDLAGLDVVLMDLQDVGSRYYTFVWTCVLVMRDCLRAGVKVIVLDRPNPIGATVMEGRTLDAAFRSFVGLEPTAVRHALTLGELVAFYADAEGAPKEAVRVVSVHGWSREAHAPSWDRPFVTTSPNMPSYETALVYPGGCLLEGTNLSEGRGTTRPFEIFGAPWLDGERLAKALMDHPSAKGFVARPLTFFPMFQKHQKTVCGGVQIHVHDATQFRPFYVYLAAIGLARAQDPESFRFRTERYEFIDHIPALDLLTGNAWARERMIAGDDPFSIAQAVAAVGDPEADLWSRAQESGRLRGV